MKTEVDVITSGLNLFLFFMKPRCGMEPQVTLSDVTPATLLLSVLTLEFLVAVISFLLIL